MSTPDLKAPPAKVGEWHFQYEDGAERMTWPFPGKTWLEARAKACALFGCEPADVVCVGRPV